MDWLLEKQSRVFNNPAALFSPVAPQSYETTGLWISFTFTKITAVVERNNISFVLKPEQKLKLPPGRKLLSALLCSYLHCHLIQSASLLDTKLQTMASSDNNVPQQPEERKETVENKQNQVEFDNNYETQSTETNTAHKPGSAPPNRPLKRLGEHRKPTTAHTNTLCEPMAAAANSKFGLPIPPDTVFIGEGSRLPSDSLYTYRILSGRIASTLFF